jgi:aminoethylphosphonate catabolism LysR family transcriptional regulator
VGRGVRLTPLGQSLFAVTTRLFASEDEARALLAGAQALTRGHLRVAADSATHVMPLLAELRRRHASVTFSLRVGNSSEALRRLLEYDADVAVMAKRTSDPRIHSQHLRTDRLVLFAPRSHPWAHRDRVLMQELNGRDLVIRERGSITRETFEARLAEAGVKPGALIEVETREAVREAVVAGFGVGVVFRTELGDDSDLRALSVEDADLSVDEYVACLEERRRTPLVRGFLDVAREASRGAT